MPIAFNTGEEPVLIAIDGEMNGASWLQRFGKHEVGARVAPPGSERTKGGFT